VRSGEGVFCMCVCIYICTSFYILCARMCMNPIYIDTHTYIHTYIHQSRAGHKEEAMSFLREGTYIYTSNIYKIHTRLSPLPSTPLTHIQISQNPTVKSLEQEVQRLQRRASSRSVLLKKQGSSGSNINPAVTVAVKARILFIYVCTYLY
jgi:hypothetical protein